MKSVFRQVAALPPITTFESPNAQKRIKDELICKVNLADINMKAFLSKSAYRDKDVKGIVTASVKYANGKYVQDWAEENRKMLREIGDYALDEWYYDDSKGELIIPTNNLYTFDNLQPEEQEKAITDYIEGYAEGTGYEEDDLPSRTEVRFNVMEGSDELYTEDGELWDASLMDDSGEGRGKITIPFRELFKDEQALLAWELKKLFGFDTIPTEITNTDNNRPYILTSWKPIPLSEPESTLQDGGFDWREEDDMDYQFSDDATLIYQLNDVKTLDDLRSETDPVIELPTTNRINSITTNKQMRGWSVNTPDWVEVKRYNRRISDGVWSRRSDDADTMALPPLLTRRIKNKQYVNFGTGFTNKAEAIRSANRLRSRTDSVSGKRLVNVRTVKGSINGIPVWRNYVGWRDDL